MIYGESYEACKAREKALMRDHQWFAWYPVSLEDGRRAWLEPVIRYLDVNPRGDYWRYKARGV